ncbi:OmpA family protein [Oceanibium sediminis]|uniref:OmpA family protein n=1 Tax=Oceanibium sediminis TaxID=2026339 RepID=UPI000DD4AA9A|nr:OmpA family protein [Oceanibium sediminis]
MSMKLKSTTAIVVALSFMQPLPGLTQARIEIPEALPAQTLETTLVCLENFQGKRKDAEQACQDALVLAGVTCDPDLLQAGDGPDNKQKDKGKSPERIAERIIRAANAEACASDDAASAAELKTQAADGETKALADTLAAADAKAAAEVKATVEADADVETAAKTAAQVESDAAAKAAAQVESDIAVKAAARAAKAEKADAKAEAKAAKVEARSDAKSAAVAEAEALAQAKKAAETAASEAAARAAAESTECAVELVDAAGATLCADDMTQAGIAAVTAAATPKADVTTETVTEKATRSSDQEFAGSQAGSGGDGLSNLEKAGLLALGAVVVGAILTNGQKVTAKTGDRVVVQDQYGNYTVLKDDDVLVREAGSNVRTETFKDGSTRSFVTRKNGVQIVTIRDSQGQVLRRTRIEKDGREVVLIDDTRGFEPVEVTALPSPYVADPDYRDATDRAALRKALKAAERRDLGRSFSLNQVRKYREVRDLAPEINLRSITFRTGSAAILPSEAEQLREIGLLMVDYVSDDPREVFLIEGYTDAIGDESYNLLLSDRRAESVALALSEYFGVRPENMVVQGYGERFPLVATLEAERLNRRVAVRRITSLIQPR